MGHALLLQRSGFLELVLQLSLCPADFRSVVFLLLISMTLLTRVILDLRDVDKMEFHFDLGKPFRPFEQLMGVLPAASKDLIPPAYQVPSILPRVRTASSHHVFLGPDVRG